MPDRSLIQHQTRECVTLSSVTHSSLITLQLIQRILTVLSLRYTSFKKWSENGEATVVADDGVTKHYWHFFFFPVFKKFLPGCLRKKSKFAPKIQCGEVKSSFDGTGFRLLSMKKYTSNKPPDISK